MPFAHPVLDSWGWKESLWPLMDAYWHELSQGVAVRKGSECDSVTSRSALHITRQGLADHWPVDVMLGAVAVRTPTRTGVRCATTVGSCSAAGRALVSTTCSATCLRLMPPPGEPIYSLFTLCPPIGASASLIAWPVLGGCSMCRRRQKCSWPRGRSLVLVWLIMTKKRYSTKDAKWSCWYRVCIIN